MKFLLHHVLIWIWKFPSVNGTNAVSCWCPGDASCQSININRIWPISLETILTHIFFFFIIIIITVDVYTSAPCIQGRFTNIGIRYTWLSHGSVNIPMKASLIARFMGPTWGPSGADRTQVGPILAPWNMLYGVWCSCSLPCPKQPPLNFGHGWVTTPHREHAYRWVSARKT